jgi:hypothetical protein
MQRMHNMRNRGGVLRFDKNGDKLNESRRKDDKRAAATEMTIDLISEIILICLYSLFSMVESQYVV